MIPLILAASIASVPVVSPRERITPVVVGGEIPTDVTIGVTPSVDSLVLLFPSNVDTLSDDQKSKVKRMRIRKAHAVGYSDVWGDEGYNMKVSERRAKNAAALIPGATYEGAGETSKFGKENRRVIITGE